MKVLFAILILLTAFNTIPAQVTQEWVARYNGPGNSSDGATSVFVDSSGNVYVTGASTGSGSANDYATIKYNSAGVQLWIARYNGPGNLGDYARSIAVDGSGNVYVTGESWGSGTGTDCATIKYNASGIQQWVARYNGSANNTDYANSIALDVSGNVYMTGTSLGIGTNTDYVTIKYNSSGDSVWVKRYNGPGNLSDAATSITVDGLGNVFVTGYSFGGVTANDYATIKYNSAGAEQWVSRYNGTGSFDDKAKSIVVDGLGNVYVTGGSDACQTNYCNDYATIKYNSSGLQQWVARYNSSANNTDYANSIKVDNYGNVYVTGTGFVTIKYNSSGDTLWCRKFGEGEAYSIAVDGSGNVYLTGSSFSNGPGFDYVTLKYNSAGLQQWNVSYNGPGNYIDDAYAIALDGSGNVYVTGKSLATTSGGSGDYATIKYSQSVGINQISSLIPEQFSLSQNHPNPFNPTTNIEFSLPQKSFITLKVFDITGKEVAELVNEYLSPGTFRYEFNAENLPSGLYFYKLETEKFSETKKMIVLK